MEYIENRTFDEIRVGDSASVVRTLSQEDIELFAVMSGDVNPAHLDEEYAKSDMFQKIIAHGMWGGALISTVLGTKLPGPGTIYLGQTLKFKRPVGVGDTVTVTATVVERDDDKKRLVLDCTCVNQDGKPVIEGQATVIAPTEKVRRPRPELPEVLLWDRGARLKAIVERALGQEPIRAAIVHAVRGPLLKDALEAARIGLIRPVLVGPEARIRAAAEAEGIDIKGVEIVSTQHSHEAAARAVAMARALEVEAIIQNTQPGQFSGYIQELMLPAVERHTGIRTNRRISHVYVMDVPNYPRPLLLTDALINTDPAFADKPDIVQNAIDLARLLGIETPKVALLAAINRVDPRLRSTMEAAALCKMAERGQITGGIVDGPLTYDTAVSEKAAEQSGLRSPVAGKADIVVAPDLEAAELLAKQLKYLAGAREAGIVLGARVPIVLFGVADDTASHLASCALAVLAARSKTAS
ncbi:MAG: bifunctional enoyl-CoA hydratase/phosphate acetyltransferase [Magnetospirillum sp. WYHS-4]